MENQIHINNVIITICNSLINNNIRFCAAGGIAVSVWGHIRATEDFDIIALIDDNDEKKIIEALQEHFNVIPHKEKILQKSLTPMKRYILISNASHFILDILLAHNDFLQQCINNSKKFTLSGTVIPVISIEDLIVIKCNAGRYQDIADIQALVTGSIPINRGYIISQLEKLHIPVPVDIMNLISSIKNGF